MPLFEEELAEDAFGTSEVIFVGTFLVVMRLFADGEEVFFVKLFFLCKYFLSFSCKSVL